MRREGFLRNFIFGIEDALVSTVGFISGIAAASVSRSTLLLSGLVLITVEAFSMAVGSFLSDESVQQDRLHGRAFAGPSIAGGFVMFLSYMFAGLFVLLPYWILPGGISVVWSVLLSLVALFSLGAFAAKLTGMRPLWRGIRMALIGGVAILLGIIVARTLS